MKRYIILVCLAISLILLFSCQSFAAFWDNFDVPLPSGAKLSQSQNIQVGEVERKTTTYRTSQTPEEILEFFRSQMPARGWVADTAFIEGMQKFKLPEEQMPAAMSAIQNNMLNFTKGDYTMFVVVVPMQPRSNFTIFTINYGKRFALTGDNGKPAKKLDFMPVYPEARQMFSTESTYIYRTDADIDSVISFYKQDMPNYGWQLQEETPVTETGMGSADIFEQDCPDCPKVTSGVTSGKLGDSIPDDIKNLVMERVSKIKVKKSGLKYTKSGGKAVTIEFKQADTAGAMPTAVAGTEISVHIK